MSHQVVWDVSGPVTLRSNWPLFTFSDICHRPSIHVPAFPPEVDQREHDHDAVDQDVPVHQLRGRIRLRGKEREHEDEDEEDERDEVNREAVLAEAEVRCQERFVAPSL